jgi:protease I
MADIAVIVDDMFEDSEYSEPTSAFVSAGHNVVNIGLNEGKTVKGKRGREKTTIERSITDVDVDDYDALLIPGGYSPDKLRVNEEAVDFVKQFVESGKPVFAICHAPQLLISAQILNGRKITGWKSIIQDIKNAGAEFIDEEVVVDNNLVSSRSPRDLPAFINTSLKKIEKK